MAHAQKPNFVFRRNRRVYLNRQGRQFSRLLAVEVCPSAVVMLDTPCSEVVWRVLATHSIRQFPLHFPSRAAPCAITLQLDSTANCNRDVHWLTVLVICIGTVAMCERIAVGHWRNDTEREHPQHWEKTLSQCHFVHDNSQMNWPETEPGPPPCVAGY